MGMTSFQFVKQFADTNSIDLSNILGSEYVTRETITSIQRSLDTDGVSLTSSDVDLVVFGSVARNECTIQSDIDWTLLVDGSADPYHNTIVNLVRRQFTESGLQPPGASGMFGQIAFSHDLIHYIGGEDDSNHNLTRRILMLLESDKILTHSEDSKYGTSYDRVLRGIINQYIDHDSGFNSERGSLASVPRFLLNDIIRFWRTMCVDFALKQREQDGRKWALRNIKLRISRKLIFVKGLLMCQSCYMKQTNPMEVKSKLWDLSIMKPLDVLINMTHENGINLEYVKLMLLSYDKFIAILNDETKRNHLTELNMMDVYQDSLFLEAQSITDEFQENLDFIFVKDRNPISDFTLKYAIF